MSGRRKAFTQNAINCSQFMAELFPPNPRRCALYITHGLLAGLGTVTLDGSRPTTSGNPIKGIVVTATAPLFLDEEEVKDNMTGPVNVQSDQASGSMQGIEWFYVD